MKTNIRLEEKQIVLDGNLYTLHVNMSVLDRLQESNGGEIGPMLKKSVGDAMAEIMAAMLNDSAEDKGWDEEWTAKKVKKTFTLAAMKELDVFGMFARALSPVDDASQKTKEADPEDKTGN